MYERYDRDGNPAVDDTIDYKRDSEPMRLISEQDFFLFHRALHAAMSYMQLIQPAFAIADTPLCHESVRKEYEEYATLHRAHFGEVE